ncbi:unnamed protein product [Diamesa serratosioi]
MSEAKSNLSLLFERPTESTFHPKDNGTKIFDVPASFLTDRYKGVIRERIGNESKFVPIKNIVLPDISFVDGLKKNEAFSLFLTKHQDIATKLTQLFMDQPDIESLLAVAVYCRDRTNVFLFQYSYSVAIQHRPDTKNVKIPSAVELFPDQFIDPSVLSRFTEEAKLDVGVRQAIEMPRNYTANDRENEQRLAYFREDIGVNLHHWHWHLVYPGSGPIAVVNKDRRGELFYYMHSQLLARYNIERFSSGLPKLKILNLAEPIDEAYFPKIIRSSNSRAYPPRGAGIRLKDVNREETVNPVTVAELIRYIERIHEAIDSGFYRDINGNSVKLTEEDGIDILGNLLEASAISKNPKYYGSLHNLGHDLIAYAHDPDGRFLEEFGVMGDVTTAMRDPLFYRWHGFLDSLWTKYKDTLPQYPDEQLNYGGVTVTSIKLKIPEERATENKLITHLSKVRVDLGAGMDFGGAGAMNADFTHLDHINFNYSINVTSSRNVMGTCRIFLGPTTNERGDFLTFREQRRLMIEMDKFTVPLKAGENIITRDSRESTVTIPLSRSLSRLENVPTADSGNLQEHRFCGCGFPHHMLLPKGTTGGTIYDVFVMISNYKDDAITPANNNPSCSDAHSFCGIRDAKYPDKRKMGYPFDRVYVAETLQDFADKYTNMHTIEINIEHMDTIIGSVQS